MTSAADEILRRDHKSNRTLTFARNSWNLFCERPSIPKGLKANVKESEAVGSVKSERGRQNGNRDEKRRKRSNLVSPPGNSIGEFYNEVRSGMCVCVCMW